MYMRSIPVLPISDCSAHESWTSLSTLAELVIPNARSRSDFIDECTSGTLDGVLVIYRTFDSVDITGRFDEDLVRVLPKSVKFVCHNGERISQFLHVVTFLVGPACIGRVISCTYSLLEQTLLVSSESDGSSQNRTSLPRGYAGFLPSVRLMPLRIDSICRAPLMHWPTMQNISINHVGD